MYNGRRQPSCGGTSRMTRECQVRICEGLGVQFPGPTRQLLILDGSPESRATSRQDTIDAGFADRFDTKPLARPIAEPLPKSFLLVRSNLVDRFAAPEFGPIAERQELCLRTRKAFGMPFPVGEQDRLNQNCIRRLRARRSAHRPVVLALRLRQPKKMLAVPVSQLSCRRRNVCCAKADTARLSSCGIVPGPALVAVWSLGMFGDPVFSNLAESIGSGSGHFAGTVFRAI